MPFMYSPYWTCSGRSRPRFLVIRAIWSLLQTLLPHIVAAGLVGAAKNSRKVVTDTAKRVSTASSTRRMKKRNIALTFPRILSAHGIPGAGEGRWPVGGRPNGRPPTGCS